MARGYGAVRWGGAPWGSPTAPPRFRVELRNESFVLQGILDKEVRQLKWEYNRIGGCGAFSFSLPRRFNEQGNLGGDFDIRIYKRRYAATYDLWYSGFIEDRMPNFGEPEFISVNGYGYVAQLSRVIVNATYTNDEISVIVKSILDTYVTPNTDITYDAGDIEATTFTADSLTFKTTAMNALRTLAELAGTREWGVGSDRKFFFKARSSTVGNYYQKGHKVKSYSVVDSFKNIKNKIYLEGGETGGAKFERTIEDTDSQTRYGLREQIVQNSAITTNDVADQYGGAVLVEKAELSRRGRIIIANENTQIEDTVPLELLVFRERGVRYGEELYGTFLYAGDVEYQINKISYVVNDDSSLVKRMNLGQLRPSMAEEIGRLDHELDMLRAART